MGSSGSGVHTASLKWSQSKVERSLAHLTSISLFGDQNSEGGLAVCYSLIMGNGAFCPVHAVSFEHANLSTANYMCESK